MGGMILKWGEGGGGGYPFTDYENCKDQTINHSNIYELFDLLGYQESIL